MSSGANVPADEGLLDGLDLNAADVLSGNGPFNSESDASFLNGTNGENRSIGSGAESDDGEVAAALLSEVFEAMGEAVLNDAAEDVADVEGVGNLLVRTAIFRAVLNVGLTVSGRGTSVGVVGHGYEVERRTRD